MPPLSSQVERQFKNNVVNTDGCATCIDELDTFDLSFQILCCKCVAAKPSQSHWGTDRRTILSKEAYNSNWLGPLLVIERLKIKAKHKLPVHKSNHNGTEPNCAITGHDGWFKHTRSQENVTRFIICPDRLKRGFS